MLVEPSGNEPCWCGSTRLFRNCHLGRESMPRIPRSEHLKRAKSLRKRACCYHFDAGKDSCSNQLVRAHSISRRRGLEMIVCEGKVYRFAGDYSDFFRNSGQITVRLMGVSDVSVFGGFCARHDHELFRRIDTESFVANEESVALLTYRAL